MLSTNSSCIWLGKWECWAMMVLRMSACKNIPSHSSLVIYFFATPTHEEAEIANKWETTISKPHGPIFMIGQSEVGISSQIIFITLFSCRCKALLRLLPALANCANMLGGPKPFSWGMGFFGFWAMKWSNPAPHLPVGFLTQQSKENFSFLPHVKDSQKTFMVIQRLYFYNGFFLPFEKMGI